MTNKLWLSIAILPLTMAAIAPGAGAQGKGKGQGAEKAEQGKGRAPENPGKAPVAAPASRGADNQNQRGRGENVMAPAVAENRGGGNARGRAMEEPNRKGPPALLPASPNASPRASVASAPNRGREVARFARDLHVNEVRPSVQRFVVSNRPAEYITGGAISYALARGIPDNSLVIVPSGTNVWVRNKRGDRLLAIDDDRARDLGVWEVSPLAAPVTSNAPSFCRSGAGHPVWGREWCLQKGFGLGTSPDVEWAAARDIGDLVYVRPVTTTTLTEDALLSLLGPVAFDRLALHALTLGYTDPLTGVWHSDATGPTVLLVNSGSAPIAELVDGNRDQRPDLLLVALRPW